MLRLKLIAPNQNVLILNNGTEIFFSYETAVVVRTDSEILVTSKKFSVTTSKHINQFLNGFGHRKVSQEEIESYLS